MVHEEMPRTAGLPPVLRLSRRLVLSAAGSAALGAAAAGCGSRVSSAPMPAPSPAASGALGAGADSSPAPPEPSAALAQPTRAEIERRFAGRPPGPWGPDLPGIKARTRSQTIALTFDACGGPGGSGYDARLVEGLRRLRVPATLFLNARWIEANPSLARELASDSLFEIGNHGLAHVPLSTSGRSAYGIAGTNSVGGVIDEVSGGESAVASLTGNRIPWFRAGTAFYDATAVQVVAAMGLTPVGFSINSDAGATFPPGTVAAQLAAVRPGDIVIAHMNHPRSGTSAGYQAALPALVDRGLDFTTLSHTRSSLPARPRIG